MINITEIVQSSGWKNFMAKLYGLGAMVVIIGALFKIQHWPGASIMLTVGLTTEAVIFFFSAFEPIHEEVDWTLVYPELAGMTDEEEISKYKSHDPHLARKAASTGGGGGYSGSDAALAKFDQMIEEAQISPDMFKRLGEGLSNLQQTTSKMTDISDATVATNEYVSNLKAAASSLGTLTDSYNNTNESLSSSVDELAGSYKKSAELIAQSGTNMAEKLNSSSEAFFNEMQTSSNELINSYKAISEAMTSGMEFINKENTNYTSQLENLNKNMAALNAVYQLQLQENDDYRKKSEAVYAGLGEMMDNLKASVEETDKYRQEMSNLQQNLASLNQVYGSMLSAMNYNQNKG